MTIPIGTTVYVNWYDFQKSTEYLCKGELVDNTLFTGTKWEDFAYVRFQPPGLQGPICHHFLPEKVTTDRDNVPHDDCYLVCGKKTRFFEHDASVKLNNPGKLNASDAWNAMQQFKQDHWDFTSGHLSTDALDDFYTIWRDAIAAKLGRASPTVAVDIGHPDGDRSATFVVAPTAPTPTLASPVRYTAALPQSSNPTKKQLRSTGRIQYRDTIQTSIFD